jgi:hypothetical protein
MSYRRHHAGALSGEIRLRRRHQQTSGNQERQDNATSARGPAPRNNGMGRHARPTLLRGVAPTRTSPEPPHTYPRKLADAFRPSAAFKRQAEARLIILDGGTASATISTLLTRTGFRLQTSRSWLFRHSASPSLGRRPGTSVISSPQPALDRLRRLVDGARRQAPTTIRRKPATQCCRSLASPSPGRI